MKLEPEQALQQVNALEAEGNRVEAAELLERLAKDESNPARADHLRRAINLRLLTGEPGSAEESIALLRTLEPGNASLPLLEARAAALRDDYRLALALKPEDVATLSRDEQQRFWQLRIAAAEASEQPFDAIKARVRLDPLLAPSPLDPEQQALIPAEELAEQMAVEHEQARIERIENQEALWQTLAKLEVTRLEAERTTPDRSLLGWIELSLLHRSGTRDPIGALGRLYGWQRRFVAHPANAGILPRLRDELGQPSADPNRIALLLPLSGRYGVPGAAVRDGFMSAHNADRERLAPLDILIEDTGEAAEGFTERLDGALANGVGAIIGPMVKRQLEPLLAYEALPIPILALNDIESAHAPTNLYRFGLLPEDEARQMALMAHADGARRAAMLLPQSERSIQIGAAFSEAFVALGGQVVTSSRYPGEVNDYTPQIQSLFNINQSEERYQALSRVVRRRMHFEPRPREDIDALFILANPRAARALVPQLLYHGAGEIPTYATSDAYSGRARHDLDRELEGLRLGVLPWVVQEDPLKAELSEKWPEKMRHLMRFYALGVDAYRIITQLDRLPRDPETALAGATGDLFVDSKNRVRRQLVPVQFKAGQLQLENPTEVVAIPKRVPEVEATEEKMEAADEPVSGETRVGDEQASLENGA